MPVVSMPCDFQSPLSLYLHIPFCITRCTYCAFNTYANFGHLLQPLVAMLAKEMGIAAKHNPYCRVGTIYFGGGTPSLLTPAQLVHLIAVIRQNFNVTEDAEITTEANPNDLDQEYLQGIRQAGINRLSIGMQSANRNELDLFARRHYHDSVTRAVQAARAVGFQNLNLDLIYGFPLQTLASWQNSLNQAMALNPEHLSLYALGLEPDTALYTWIQKGQLPAPDDDLAADMYDLATAKLEQHGYIQYEISNWAKAGYECRHNLQYWHNLPYLGFGPGAHGFAGGIRYATISSPQQYIQALQNQDRDFDFPYTPTTDVAVKVDRETEITETLMMSLRLTRDGVARDAFQQRFGVDVLDLHGAMLERFARQGLLEIQSNRIRFTQRGRLLGNIVFRELV